MALTLVSRANRPTAASVRASCNKKPPPTPGAIATRHEFHRLALQPQAASSATPPIIQTKLTVGEPGDKFEREADQMADEVMRMPDSSVAGAAPPRDDAYVAGGRVPSASLSIQRVCTECAAEDLKLRRMPSSSPSVSPRISALNGPVAARFEFPNPVQSIQRQEMVGEEEDVLQTKPLDKSMQRQTEDEEEIVQTKAEAGTVPEVSPGIEARIHSLRGGGQDLSPAERAYFEPRFVHDFSQVRVHTDARTSEVARAVNARAFTLGHDIVFGTGQYAPGTAAGRKLLAHELTHVVQQKRSIQSNIQRKKPRTDAFGKECPDTVVIDSIKPIAGFNKALFDKGKRTWLGIYSYMKVGPKEKYESCITEVLKVEENTCGEKGRLAGYKPCTPKKHCLPVGGNKKIPTSPNIFLDMHRTSRDFNLLEDSGKKTCEVTCLQRYGCGGKEIGRFYVARTFKADTFKDGKKDVPVTLGSIKKVIAKRKK